jgi:hypothetical protein
VKPHIRKGDVFKDLWVCYSHDRATGAVVRGVGDTAEEAYDDWRASEDKRAAPVPAQPPQESYGGKAFEYDPRN